VDLKNVNLGVYRDFRITERKRLTFRTEMSNAFNLVNQSSPGTNAGSTSTFGNISTTIAMRQVQFGLRFAF
jgi:hypothetical protein